MDEGNRVTRVPGGDGLTLAAEGFGDEGDPVILLAHGGGQCRHIWAETAQQLAAVGYHVLTLDSRGHGDSDWADPPSYESEDFARDFEAVSRWRLDVDGRAPHFVGSSMSGIAGLIAASHGNHAIFASLTLVDVTPTYNEDALLKARSLFLRTAEEGFGSEADAARAAGIKPGGVDIEKVLRKKANGRWFWRWDPAFAHFIHHNAHTQQLCLAAAGALTLPVLLVRAGHSEFVTDASVAAFRSATPHLQVTMIPEARHVVTGDPEGSYANAIHGFLESISGQA